MCQPRKIIHLDMDCYYAAIEVRNNPTLRGQPVGVGGTQDRRGVLTTCNYEARKFGVRSAMPTFMAMEKCPHLIIVPVHFEEYRKESRRIRAIMGEFTEVIEPLSLDEAYLDVSHLPDAVAAATELRRRIYRITGLHASAGIAPNKLLAKIASDWRKPNGQFHIAPHDIKLFMKQLPVQRIWGVGKVAAERLEKLGITTCGQLQELSRFKLQAEFGKFGLELHELCRGVDDRPVETHRVRKSLSTERTYTHDLATLEECLERFASLFDELTEDLRRYGEARRVTGVFVKLKFSDFSQTTVGRASTQPIREVFHELLTEGFGRSGHGVRLLGAGVRFAEESSEDDNQLELPLE